MVWIQTKGKSLNVFYTQKRAVKTRERFDKKEYFLSSHSDKWAERKLPFRARKKEAILWLVVPVVSAQAIDRKRVIVAEKQIKEKYWHSSVSLRVVESL